MRKTDLIQARYNAVKLQDLVKAAPQLGLDHVLKSLVPSNYTLDTVIVSFPSFFGNLSSLLEKTPKETLQSVYLWRLTVARSQNVEGPEILPWLKLTRKLGGRVSRLRTPLSRVYSPDGHNLLY